MLGKLLEIAAQRGSEVEMLLLRKMNVHICHGCLTCEEGGRERKGICKIKDDMGAVYPKLLVVCLRNGFTIPKRPIWPPGLHTLSVEED